MKKVLGLFVALAACALPLVAQGDWDPSYPFTKWVQMPDPTGWDVCVTHPEVLADDFLCTSPDPITDIHLWGSWADDVEGIITAVQLSIHNNYPGPPSLPVDPPIWEKTICAGPNLNVEWWGSGDQGWYDPKAKDYWEHNHDEIYLVNIFLDPADWFYQTGTPEDPVVYWLDVSVCVLDPVNTTFGWKTSITQWEDDAVYWDNVEVKGWVPLKDPLTMESLDLAFAITTIPEPGVLILAGFGLLALFGLRRKK